MSFEIHSFVDVDLERCQHLMFTTGEAAVMCARKPERVGPNQDAAALIAISKTSGVAIVSDGAGGMANGARAAELSVRAMLKAIRKACGEERGLRDGILDGFEQANKAILGLGVGAGATLSVVEVQNGVIRTYHAGDSMILAVGQRGCVKLLTVPHSPVGYAVEAGLLDPEEAIHHDDLHLVSNLLGTADMRIEIGSSLKLAPRDTLILASDGLSDNVHLEEIIEGIRKGSLRKAADRLASLGRKRILDPVEGAPSKPDDMSFIALRVGVPKKKRVIKTETTPDSTD